jgi:peptidoglycan/xylan/chitin deacetylase (PgdA/CDA1 family)
MQRPWLALFLTLMLAWLLALPAGPARAASDDIAPGLRFVSIAFHDVVDDPAELNADAVTTDRLVAFFDHLRGAGWTAISLDDVDAARRGVRPLPTKAILVSFDDGYKSLYTRVFPLLLAYRIPIVAALQGSWLEGAPGTMVSYGDETVPRENFVSWDQAREMARSGLVEFASHSHDMHRGVPANPQGNTMPAAVTRQYANGAYEDGAAYRRRISDDLSRSRDQLKRELGQAPRAVVWPFGRYSATTVEIAAAAGYRFALTLDPEPADASMPMALARYLPTLDPTLAEAERNLRFASRPPSAQRLVCVDPAMVWAGDAAGADERLGQLIERLRTLGSTAVVIDAVVRDAQGRLVAAWFPTRELPLRADLLSRMAWQLQTRGGVEVFVRLPATAARETLGDAARVQALFRELGVQVPASGLWVDDAPGLLAPTDAPDERTQPDATPWQLQRRRKVLDAGRLGVAEALALQAYREVEHARPRLRLALLGTPGAAVQPSAVADLTLVPADSERASALRKIDAFTAATHASGMAPSRRVGLWLTGATPPADADLTTAMRRLQVAGGTVLGWCPDNASADAPGAAQVAPDVSASTFPVRF